MPTKEEKQSQKDLQEEPVMRNEGTQSSHSTGTQSNSKMVTTGTQSSAKGTRDKEPETARSEKDDKEDKESKKKEKKEKPERKEKPKDFFKEEISRLRESLNEEGKKIEKPTRKEFTPYTFTSLAPYLDLHSLEFLLNLPDEPDLTNTSRNVAFGMTDPWDDFKLDTDEVPPKKEEGKKKKEKKDKEEKKEDKKDERPPKEGSTRLPKFPVVSMDTIDMANKKMSYSDVPKLREEIKAKYSRNADAKVTEEYERTKNDFYRMELDKMEDIHPVNRPHMRAAYFAYLQNNPGSRKAIYECLKTMADKKREEEEEQQHGDDDGVMSSRSIKSQKSKTSERA